jgi:hypothetical protein
LGLGFGFGLAVGARRVGFAFLPVLAGIGWAFDGN